MSIFPDEPSDEERLEQLPEDNETPFRPADDINGAVVADGQTDEDDSVTVVTPQNDGGTASDDTRQETDTNIDPQEQYDEGVAGAAEIDEPNAGNTVIGYNPDEDQRKTEVNEGSQSEE